MLLFGFALRSFIVSLLYDIIVNKNVGKEDLEVKDGSGQITETPTKINGKKRLQNAETLKHIDTMNINRSERIKSADQDQEEDSPAKKQGEKDGSPGEKKKGSAFANIAFEACISKELKKRSAVAKYLASNFCRKDRAFYLRSPISNFLFKILFNRCFSFTRFIIVSLNITFLILNARSSKNELELFSTVTGFVLLGIYLMMCLALGFSTCLKNSGLLFETILIVICIADCLYTSKLYSYYSCFNIFRIISFCSKVLRFKTYQIAVQFLKLILPPLVFFLILMSIVLAIYSQMGFYLFNNLDLEISPKGIYVQYPFVNFIECVITTISIVFGNNWGAIYYKSIKDYSSTAFLYYFSIIVIAKHILFNIIVAFLLETMKNLFEIMHSLSKKRFTDLSAKMKLFTAGAGSFVTETFATIIRMNQIMPKPAAATDPGQETNPLPANTENVGHSLQKMMLPSVIFEVHEDKEKDKFSEMPAIPEGVNIKESPLITSKAFRGADSPTDKLASENDQGKKGSITPISNMQGNIMQNNQSVGSLELKSPVNNNPSMMDSFYRGIQSLTPKATLQKKEEENSNDEFNETKMVIKSKREARKPRRGSIRNTIVSSRGIGSVRGIDFMKDAEPKENIVRNIGSERRISFTAENLADPNDLYLLNARESLPVNQSPLIPPIIGFPNAEATTSWPLASNADIQLIKTQSEVVHPAAIKDESLLRKDGSLDGNRKKSHIRAESAFGSEMPRLNFTDLPSKMEKRNSVKFEPPMPVIPASPLMSRSNNPLISDEDLTSRALIPEQEKPVPPSPMFELLKKSQQAILKTPSSGFQQQVTKLNQSSIISAPGDLGQLNPDLDQSLNAKMRLRNKLSFGTRAAELLTRQRNVLLVGESFGQPELTKHSRWELMKQSSLFILHRSTTLRRKLQSFFGSITSEIIISFLIVIGGILLAIDSPILSPEHLTVKIIFWADLIINVCFSLECIGRILAYGLFYCSEKDKIAYFRSPWNILDFAVVMIGWITYGFSREFSYLRSLKVLRLARLLRTMRAIGRSTTMNLLVDTIISSISKMLIFVFFIFLCLMPYSTLGMHNYKDRYEMCELTEKLDSVLLHACPPESNSVTFLIPIGFVNFWRAMLSSAVVLTSEGFIYLYRFLTIYQEDSSPSYLMVLETFLAYYFLSLFLQNMFACITILNFLEMKQTQEGTHNLNEREMRIFELQRVFIKKSLISKKITEDRKLDSFLLTIVTSVWFEIFSMGCLMLNIAFMIVAGQVPTLDIYKIVQLVILIIYNIEAIVKMYILGFSTYYSDSFNSIDFTSTVLCDILALLFFNAHLDFYFMTPVLIRLLTLGRFLRRILRFEHKISRSLKGMIDALQLSIISLFPMIVIIIIVISAYAIIAMNLFYMIPAQNEVNAVFNFRNFFSSFLNLLKLLMGYKWNILLEEIANDVPGCIHKQTYEELEVKSMGCGEPVAYFFILQYIVLGKFMLLNMITVLVIDGYLESKKLDNIKFSEAEIDELYRMWAQYDPDKTGLMKCDNFILFLHQLYAPFGILDKDNPKHIKPSHIVNKFIYREDLKVIVTVKELQETVKQFPIYVYETGGEYFVHFVDYITHLTNKIYPEYNAVKLSPPKKIDNLNNAFSNFNTNIQVLEAEKSNNNKTEEQNKETPPADKNNERGNLLTVRSGVKSRSGSAGASSNQKVSITGSAQKEKSASPSGLLEPSGFLLSSAALRRQSISKSAKQKEKEKEKEKQTLKVFTHYKLSQQWNIKFRKYPEMIKKQDFISSDMMTLDQYYSYKIVVRKLMTYGRLNRLKPLAHAATGKEQYKDICVEGNHTTHKQNVSYLFYNSLVQSAPEAKIQFKKSKPLKEEETKITGNLIQSEKRQEIFNNANKIRSIRSTQQQNAIRDEEMTAGVESKAEEPISVKEIESIDNDIGIKIFNEDDLKSEKSDDSLSNKAPSMYFD